MGNDQYNQGFEDGKENYMPSAGEFLNKNYREGWTAGRNASLGGRPQVNYPGSGGGYSERKGCRLWT